MSGHSKWSTIKRKKGATDAKRGQIFTKLAREISVAARQGGPDPDSNFRLRLAVQRARGVNMPADNIKRAIDRATSESGGDNYDEVVYEGYGPGGTAVIVEALTDNRNRTVSEIRSVFNRAGGRLGENGSVSWLFDQRGLLAVEPADSESLDEIALAVIEAGAEDVNELPDENLVEVYTNLQDLKAVEGTLASQGLKVTSAEKTYTPKTTVELSDQDAQGTLRLLEKLEDLDDVQGVYSNLEVDSEVAVNSSV
jgi:YebC/PmpR family DNA-binding regulatory protein